MRFGEYLVSKGKLGKKDADRISVIQGKTIPPLGKLALDKKMLTLEDVSRIRTYQRQMKNMFGTVAVDLNLLSSRQVETLLDLQDDHKEPFGELLVANDFLSPSELLDELRLFRGLHKKKLGARYRVALLDMDRDLLQEINEAINQKGYDVVSHDFSDESLRKIVSDNPDFVIVNLVKNGNDIIESFSRVCTKKEVEALNVLAVVTSLSPEWRKKAANAGITDFTPVTASMKKIVDYMESVLKADEEVRPSRILLVDDSPTLLKFTSAILGDNGYEIDTAESGEAALEKLEKISPDLILSDVHMPGMSGVEFCRIVKSNPLLRDIPILMLTTDKKSNKIKEALDAGASDYIVKPFRNEELLARARAHIRTKILFDEIQKSKKELMAVNEKLAELNDRKTEFLATVAHDLRTPLTSIRTYAELMRMFKNKPEDQEEFLGIILAETIRMSGLINNYLDISRIDLGTGMLRCEKFDLSEIVRYFAKIYRHMAVNKGIRFETTIPDKAYIIKGDQERFPQVLSNLLDNAIKFTPNSGTISMAMSSLGRREKKYAEIVVSNTGEGISQEAEEYIFKKYHQVPQESQTIKGTGLGLAICKEIVEAHGGKIEVESNKDGVTSFRILIPLIDAE